jgi:glycosyltransferase involved in cell wall biosynthesis
MFPEMAACDMYGQDGMGISIRSPSRKDIFVQRSLSVLVPVRDAQATLTASVHEILDVAADSGSQFEIVIIDDGSSDATSEVAHELTQNYPQVKVVRHPRPVGREAAIHSGLRRSKGDLVVVHEGRQGYRIIDRSHGASQTPSRPVRPNFLSRLKNFALGE